MHQLARGPVLLADDGDPPDWEARARDALAALEVAEATWRAKSAFLVAMSREICAPLLAIGEMTRLLGDLPLPPDQPDLAATVQAAGAALRAILDDIHDFARIESDQLTLDSQPFNLQACVEDALALYGAMAPEKQVALSYLIEPAEPTWVVGDAPRLRQILVNLVANVANLGAADAVGVRVSSRLLNPQCYEIAFAVQAGDAGHSGRRPGPPGGPVSAAGLRRYDGSGLGLLISQRLSELMGGRMWLAGPAEPGAIYHFTIRAPAGRPAAAPDEPPAAASPDSPPAPEAPPGDPLPLRILLAEDSTVSRQLALHTLDRLGYQATAVGTGMAVLAALERERYDVVLMDMQMPEMDGLGASEAIGAIWPGASRPHIIALTANDQPEDRAAYLAAGIADFLSKPLRAPELQAALARCTPLAADLPDPATEPALPADDPAPEFAPLAADPTQREWALLAELDELLGRETVQELVEEFLSQTALRIAGLGDALRLGDADQLRRGAHSVKGNSGSLGATRLAAVAAVLEQAAYEAIPADADRLLAEIEREFARAGTWLTGVFDADAAAGTTGLRTQDDMAPDRGTDGPSAGGAHNL